MLRINQLKLKVGHSEEQLKKKLVRELKIRPEELQKFEIRRQSIDARKKPELYYVYSIDVQVKKEKEVLKKHPKNVQKTQDVYYQMPKLFEFLEQYSDYIIIGLLLLMSVIMLATVIERFIFLSRVNVAKYSNIHSLEIDLNRNMTTISTVGANAPYVGLLGTVIGILLTFYQIGQAGGDVDAGAIMMHLSLALKATALGILVAIPSMMFYNGLGRKVEVNLLKWKVLNAQKDKE